MKIVAVLGIQFLTIRSASAIKIDLHISAANSVAMICFSGWSSGKANSATRIIFGILKIGMLTVNKN